MVEKYKNKKVLIVGLGKTGFALINLFNQLGCQIKVTDIKPIFDLNKAVKRLKRIKPSPLMTFGEHKKEDFEDADIIVYSAAINPEMDLLVEARKSGKEVFSEFGFAYENCNKPIIAVCGTYGRTTIAHMITYALKLDGKNVFVGGTSEDPFCNIILREDYNDIDYVVVEASAKQLQSVQNFHPRVLIYANIDETSKDCTYVNVNEYLENMLRPLSKLTSNESLVVNFDTLSSNSLLRNCKAETYWYTRRSFVNMGLIEEVQGTHFHEKRIQSNINFHSDYRVNKMRIIGKNNRENLLAAISVAKILEVSDESIQNMIQNFPGIPNRLEFVTEKSGVKFYNDTKSETMDDLVETLENLKEPAILITGGLESETIYENYEDVIRRKVRIMVITGEAKENMNRSLGDLTQTFLVGSFDESVLLAFQKSRTGDTIILCPGHKATDIFRDFEEKGNFYKKLIYQL